MSESLPPNNLTPNNSQAYEANLNEQGSIIANLTNNQNDQTQIDKTTNETNSETKSKINELNDQKKIEADTQNSNTIVKQENESINSLENSSIKINNIQIEKSKSEQITNKIEPLNIFESTSRGQNTIEQPQIHTEDSNSQEEQNIKIQRVSSNSEDQIHPINTPIAEIYGVDRNFRNDLIFTVSFSRYNKIVRVTNKDMKKYHQPELINLYVKCMTFGQPIDLPPYKPR